MTRTKSFLGAAAAAAAAVALTAAFAAPASAMTCVDFVNMTPDERLAAAEEMDMGGRMAARDMANNAESDAAGEAHDESTKVDEAADSGQEAQREMGRGEDVVLRVIEDCARKSEDNLDDIIDARQ